MKLRTIVLLALVACGTESEPAYVARIGETTLSKEEFRERAQKLMQTGYKHIEEMNADAKLALLNGVIARELLVREGLRRGLDREPSIAREVERTEQRAVMNKLYEEEALHGDYTSTEEELRTFAKEREYDVEVLSQQIVCATEEEALEVLMALQEGSPFESLVPIYSNGDHPAALWPGWPVGVVQDGPHAARVDGTTADHGRGPTLSASGEDPNRLSRLPTRQTAARGFCGPARVVARKSARAKAGRRYGTICPSPAREYELEAHDEGLKALAAPDGEERVLFSWRGGQLSTAGNWANIAANHSRLDSAARYKAVENLAGVQIMMAEGRKLQYDRDPEVREPVEQKRDALIVEWLYRTEGREVARQQPITEEDIRVYYDATSRCLPALTAKLRIYLWSITASKPC